jgi:hypothetical protein
VTRLDEVETRSVKPVLDAKGNRIIYQAADVEAIRPGPDRVRYVVDGPKGLRLEVWPTGTKTYVVQYRPRGGGNPETYTLGSTSDLSLREARAEADRVRAEVRLGRNPQRERIIEREREKQKQAHLETASVTNIDMLTRHALWMYEAGEHPPDGLSLKDPLVLKPRTIREWRRIAQKDVIPAFAGRQATSLTRTEIQTWAAKIKRDRAPSSALVAWEVLRSVYSWAIGCDLLEHTPFFKLKPPHTRGKSDRVLSLEELGYLTRALKILERGRGNRYTTSRGRFARKRSRRHYCSIVRLLLLTMVRVTNVVEMRRSELEGLDDQYPVWVIPGHRMKSLARLQRSPHRVPLCPQAVAIIRERLRATDGLNTDFLFPRLRAKAGIVDPLLTLPVKWSSRFVNELESVMNRLRHKDHKILARRYKRPDPLLIPIADWTIHNIRHTLATHMRSEDMRAYLPERCPRITREIVKRLLAHVETNTTDIYDQSDLMSDRRIALQAWANWLDDIMTRRLSRRSQVVDMHEAKAK